MAEGRSPPRSRTPSPDLGREREAARVGVEEEEAEYHRLLADREEVEVRLRADQRALRESEDRILRHIAESRAGESPTRVGGADAASRSDAGQLLSGETPAPREVEGRRESSGTELAQRIERAVTESVSAAVAAQLVGLSERLERLEAGRPAVGGVGERSRERDDRRATVSVQGTEVPVSTFPKSLRDPRMTARFVGSPKEDVDQFLRLFETETEMVEAVFATPMLLRCLGEVPAHALRQHFGGRIADVKFEAAAAFLRARYRKPTHVHDVMRRVLSFVQKGSAEMFFASVEERLALVGVDPERATNKTEALLIAVVSRGLKERVYSKLREDPQRLTESYRYKQFKADAIAIDSSLFSAAPGKSAPRVAWADITEEWDRERETEKVMEVEQEEKGEMEDWLQDRSEEEIGELRVLLGFGQQGGRGGGRGGRGRGGYSGAGRGAGRFSNRSGESIPRQPAYQFPKDYKGDKMCRYCRKTDHLTPLCDTLYKNRNHGAAMSESLRREIKNELGNP